MTMTNTVSAGFINLWVRIKPKKENAVDEASRSSSLSRSLWYIAVFVWKVSQLQTGNSQLSTRNVRKRLNVGSNAGQTENLISCGKPIGFDWIVRSSFCLLHEIQQRRHENRRVSSCVCIWATFSIHHGIWGRTLKANSFFLFCLTTFNAQFVLLFHARMVSIGECSIANL